MPAVIISPVSGCLPIARQPQQRAPSQGQSNLDRSPWAAKPCFGFGVSSFSFSPFFFSPFSSGGFPPTGRAQLDISAIRTRTHGHRQFCCGIRTKIAWRYRMPVAIAVPVAVSVHGQQLRIAARRIIGTAEKRAIAPELKPQTPLAAQRAKREIGAIFARREEMWPQCFVERVDNVRNFKSLVSPIAPENLSRTRASLSSS